MEKEIQKLPSDLVSDIKTRLKTISGQTNGIVKMLDIGKDPEQINIQFKSVDKGVQKAHFLLLDETYRKALAIGIVKAIESCPGNCGNEDKIKYLKNEFPNLELTELAGKLKEIQTIENRLKDYNEKKIEISLVTAYTFLLHLCSINKQNIIMNRIIILIISIFSTSIVLAQGPPIFTETPILLGLDGGGIRTFGRFIVKENATVYVQPVGIPYNLGSKTQIGIVGKYINITPHQIQSVSGFGDLTFFAKQQLYQKNGKGKTFRIIAKLDQVFPTGKTSSTPSIGSDAWQSQLSLVTGYVTLKYGVYGQVGYNITTNDLADNIIYNFAFVYPLLPQKYPPNQLNLNIGFNGNYKTDIKSKSLFLSSGVQWILSKTTLFETGIQIPLIEEVNEAQKTKYILTFGTRILIF